VANLVNGVRPLEDGTQFKRKRRIEQLDEAREALTGGRGSRKCYCGKFQKCRTPIRRTEGY
jgi:hypothetical protein